MHPAAFSGKRAVIDGRCATAVRRRRQATASAGRASLASALEVKGHGPRRKRLAGGAAGGCGMRRVRGRWPGVPGASCLQPTCRPAPQVGGGGAAAAAGCQPIAVVAIAITVVIASSCCWPVQGLGGGATETGAAPKPWRAGSRSQRAHESVGQSMEERDQCQGSPCKLHLKVLERAANCTRTNSARFAHRTIPGHLYSRYGLPETGRRPSSVGTVQSARPR